LWCSDSDTTKHLYLCCLVIRISPWACWWESDCSLLNCHIVCFFMWRCASASVPWSRHKQYEWSEIKVRMFRNIVQCWRFWPSGLQCCVIGLVVLMFWRIIAPYFFGSYSLVQGWQNVLGCMPKLSITILRNSFAYPW
jgi:hypothetical protein